MGFPINTDHLTKAEYDELVAKHVTQTFEVFKANGSKGEPIEKVLDDVRKHIAKLGNKVA